MTAAQRGATKRYRERGRTNGLRRLEVQVPAGDAEIIRKAAAILRDRPEDAAHLRAHLGFESAGNKPANAYELFAMEQPLSKKGESLWNEAMKQIEDDRRDAVLSRTRRVDF